MFLVRLDDSVNTEAEQRGNNMSPENIFDIISCLENGDSVNDIAADYEITVSQVRQIEFEYAMER